jgi:hypothetical protein
MSAIDSFTNQEKQKRIQTLTFNEQLRQIEMINKKGTNSSKKKKS